MNNMQTDPWAYQVLSRNNDPSGNPYRLVLVYSEDGGVRRAYEARSSSPNIIRKLGHLAQLPTIHCTPAEYNATRATFKHVLQHVD